MLQIEKCNNLKQKIAKGRQLLPFSYISVANYFNPSLEGVLLFSRIRYIKFKLSLILLVNYWVELRTLILCCIDPSCPLVSIPEKGLVNFCKFMAWVLTSDVIRTFLHNRLISIIGFVYKYG